MRFKDMEFDWDEGNTHKILLRFSLEEVEAFFTNDLIFADDTRFPYEERRELAVGKGPQGRYMYVCFTIRGNRIRVISARFMREKEVRKYEAYKKSKEE